MIPTEEVGTTSPLHQHPSVHGPFVPASPDSPQMCAGAVSSLWHQPAASVPFLSVTAMGRGETSFAQLQGGFGPH